MYLNQLDLETLGSQLLLPQIVPDISLQQELVGSHTGNSLDRPRRSQCASGPYILGSMLRAGILIFPGLQRISMK